MSNLRQVPLRWEDAQLSLQFGKDNDGARIWLHEATLCPVPSEAQYCAAPRQTPLTPIESLVAGHSLVSASDETGARRNFGMVDFTRDTLPHFEAHMEVCPVQGLRDGGRGGLGALPEALPSAWDCAKPKATNTADHRLFIDLPRVSVRYLEGQKQKYGRATGAGGGRPGPQPNSEIAESRARRPRLLGGPERLGAAVGGRFLSYPPPPPSLWTIPSGPRFQRQFAGVSLPCAVA